MAKTEGGGSLVSWSGLAAAIVGTYLLFTVKSPLDTARPRTEGEQANRTFEGREAWARLWQDPIQVSEVDYKDPRKREGVPNNETSLKPLRTEVNFRVKDLDNLLVIPVLVSGQPYPETVETRLRCRYAVLSALQVSGYIPGNGESLRYVVAKDANGDGTFAVPYEWFEPDLHRAYGEKPPPTARRILVLWFPEERLGETPISKLKELIDHITQPLQGPKPKKARKTVNVHILGPSSSSTLPTILDEIDESEDVAAVEGPAWGKYRLYSDRATAWSKIVEEKRSHSITPFNDEPVWRSPSGFELHRTIGSDHQLAQKLLSELDLRGASTLDPERHVVLIGEWDTAYARAWRATVTSAVVDRIPQGSDGDDLRKIGTTSNLHFFTYLRGVDGRTAGDSSPGGRSAKASDSDSPKGQLGSDQAEAPVGRAQLDYVRRLAGDIERLRLQLKEKSRGNEIAAIGIIGSDVYDKLLLLRALRRGFPWANFFTSDLDARLLHPSELEWTKNLIIASHFDLTLAPELQSGVPPFRDGYQSSTFLACLWAVESDNLKRIALGDAVPIEPRVYQVSRHGAYDLSSPEEWDLFHPRTDRLDLGDGLIRLVLVPLGFVLFAGYLLLPLMHNWLSYDSLDERNSRRYLGICCIFLLMFMILVAVNGASEGGEPFLALGGISIWPTEILRIVAFCLCLWFLRIAHVRLDDNVGHLQEKYADLYGDPISEALVPQERPCPYRFAAKVLEKRKSISITFWSAEDGKEDAKSLWRKYVHLGEAGKVWRRCVPNVFAFVMLFYFICVFDIPSSRLGRGNLARKLDAGLDIVLAFSATALLFYVIDTTRLCKQWITHLSELKVSWPNEMMASLIGEDKGIEASASEHFKIKLIADRTAEVGKLMYYPFVILFLLLVARNNVFDNWNWNVSVGVTYGLAAVGAVYCGALLRYAAEQARRRAIGRVRVNTLEIGRRQAAEKSPEAKAEGLLKGILEDIEANRKGAFCPIQENPVIHAVLIPFGGIGTLELLKLIPVFL